MLVLGIETSCDETAAAVVDDTRAIRAELVASQLDEHRKFGGVVPEVAARAHLELLDGLVREVMRKAGLGFADLDVVAATGGPGLIGGVLVGVTTAKAIALAAGRKFVAVNHLEAHALTARLTDDVVFPYLLLLVSGGHCQLLVVEGVGTYRRWGTTIDDAAGEAFDKSAKLMGLGYPGGPALERAAKDGDASRFPLPRSMVGKPGCDFSFSGLKTAVRNAVQGAHASDLPHLAAATQAAIADQLADRTQRAVKRFVEEFPAGRQLVVAGGVAANATVRARLAAVAAKHGLDFVAPPPRLCTDNATMVAWAGLERARLGMFDGFDFAPRPRWPLDARAPKAAFAGVKA